MVALFEVHAASKDLRALARNGPGTPHGLMATELPTIQAVAAGLVRQADDHALDDEAAVLQWSSSAAPFEHASKWSLTSARSAKWDRRCSPTYGCAVVPMPSSPT